MSLKLQSFWCLLSFTFTDARDMISITINLMRQFVSIRSWCTGTKIHIHTRECDCSPWIPYWCQLWFNCHCSIRCSLLFVFYSIDKIWKFVSAQLFRNDGCKLTVLDKTKMLLMHMSSIQLCRRQIDNKRKTSQPAQQHPINILGFFGTRRQIMTFYDFS